MVGRTPFKPVSIALMIMNIHHVVATIAVMSALLPFSPAGASPADDGEAGSGGEHEAGSSVVLHPEPVATLHQVEIGGEALHYRALAGTLPLFDESDGSVKAEVFHVAYLKVEREGEEWVLPDPSTRPILFLFNGGPGSSSVWLHLGAFGPRRVLMGDVGSLLPAPWKVVPNDACLLDVADLVFIDPVTTGYSRAAEGIDDGQFHGLEQDADSVAEFIRLFITRHARWQSPKLIGGESYGTTRAAALATELQERHGMFLDGVVLVSSVLDFGTIRFARNNDLPYALFLPTYAATAWYHGQLDATRYPTLESVLSEAEQWALSGYLPALARGSSIGEEERERTIQALVRLTGLSREIIAQANLRVGPSLFRKELLRSSRRTVGRLDSRFIGFDADAAGDRPEYDPSYSAIQGPYTAAMNHYVRSDLGYEIDLPYEILSGRVQPWDYSGFEGRYVDVAGRLRSAMVRNPRLKVFVASGYYDLATPHFAADYVIDHLELEPEFMKHVTVDYYPAGHMMYVNDDLRLKLSEDVRDWLRSAPNE
jgi:carboxypeptidase C (cathepsin A)